EILDHRSTASDLVRWKADGCFIFGFIGQLIRRKGVDVLLKALAGLPDNLNWRAALIGDGDQKTALKAMAADLGIADRVVFFGFRENRLDFLKGFDCFVLPSKMEGIPRCLMEAMTAGIPVVASDIPGCTDLIVDGQTGRLFPVDDVPALQRALQDMMTDGGAARYGIRGREHVLSTFSARRMAKDYQRAYISLLARPKEKARPKDKAC
ncbi:MAG: glycosyltransferase, partial [Desulfobacterales bacterium]|nr:glycosyltransferase [Desulfobacterales bacterium]